MISVKNTVFFVNFILRNLQKNLQDAKVLDLSLLK